MPGRRNQGAGRQELKKEFIGVEEKAIPYHYNF